MLRATLLGILIFPFLTQVATGCDGDHPTRSGPDQTPVAAPAFTRLMRSEGINIYAENGNVDRAYERDFASDRYMRSLVGLYRSIRTTRAQQAKLGIGR